MFLMVKLAIGESPYDLERFQNGTIMTSYLMIFLTVNASGESQKGLMERRQCGVRRPTGKVAEICSKRVSEKIKEVVSGFLVLNLAVLILFFMATMEASPSQPHNLLHPGPKIF
jgi:hypothetical protein